MNTANQKIETEQAMEDSKRWRVRRLSVIGTIVGLAFAGLTLTPANAAPGNLDPDAPRSLTIHKYEQPSTGDLGARDGSEIDDPIGTALEGVMFSVQQVTDIDLTSEAGWAAAQDLTVEAAQSGTLGNDLAAGTATDANGVISLSDVPLGVYLVQETSAGPNNIVSAAVPFLVTVPLPNGDGDWNYAVHVYPKNTVLDQPTKVVDQEGANKIGDTVTWTITSEIPVLSEGDSYTDFAIQDDLDERLDYTSATVTGSEGLQLTAADYQITPSAAQAGGPVVEIAFTAAGLEKLNALGDAAGVVVTLNTTVNSIGSGSIPNQAAVFVNDPDRANGTVSNVPTVNWGALEVTKHADGDDTKTLAGAHFDLYAQDPESDTGAPPTLSDLTTDEDGRFLVEGLKEGSYWLVETAAPAGYVLDSTPTEIEVLPGTVASPNRISISNRQQSAFQLPMTGGSGTLTLMLLGSALVLVSVGALLARRWNRRKASLASV